MPFALVLAPYVADMSATCAYVANFLPTLHVDPTRRGLRHLFFWSKTAMPPKKKKWKDIVTATAAAAADAAAAPPSSRTLGLMGRPPPWQQVFLLQETRRNGVGMGRGSGFPGCITLFPDILKLVILFSNTHI